MALTNAKKEGIWIKQLINELGRHSSKLTVMCDNKSTLFLSNNPEFHSRTKHIDIRYHYVRDTIESIIKIIIIKIDYISTEENISDILTKGLPKIKHYQIIELIGFKKKKSVHSLIT